MRLKITEQGWETFSGTLGVVQFDQGISVGDVSHVEANIISGNIRVIDFESGLNVGALELNADAQDKPCVSFSLKTMEEVFAENAGGVAPETAVQVAQVSGKLYTKEELEAIADKQGIAGLREIGDKFGVKSTSIASLIDAILQVQFPESVAAPLQEGQEG